MNQLQYWCEVKHSKHKIAFSVFTNFFAKLLNLEDFISTQSSISFSRNLWDEQLEVKSPKMFHHNFLVTKRAPGLFHYLAPSSNKRPFPIRSKVCIGYIMMYFRSWQKWFWHNSDYSFFWYCVVMLFNATRGRLFFIHAKLVIPINVIRKIKSKL